MSQLLGIAIGPVQGFIASARRTRDLWSGSRLISEVSKAVAKKIAGSFPGGLIFPNPVDPSGELEPDSDYLVSNILLCVISDGVDAARFSADCEFAAIGAWEAVANRALSDAGAAIDEARFLRQMKGVVEYYAAWASFSSDAEYPNARQAVNTALSARKACRDFAAWDGEAGVPKSSLGGERESVWRRFEVERLPKRFKAQLRPSRGEQLDCIGLTKRLGFGNRQFPSVSRLAAESWLMHLPPRTLAELREAADPLRAGGLVYLREARFPQFRHFPYDGSICYPERMGEIEPTEDMDRESQARWEEAKANWKNVLERSKRGSKATPSPYMAVLLADGDRMGAAISSIMSAHEHRDFSRALAGFAGEAREIVEAHHGALVFAGGDDVLALVPANAAIACAGSLRRAFLRMMTQWTGPTLSVGIGIGHSMEDLEDLLQLARRAEKTAKHPDRDGLAVIYAPRGQRGREVRRRWIAMPEDEYFEMVAHYRGGAIPDKAAYQLEKMAEHYRGWPTGAPNLVDAMRADAGRLFQRKTGGMNDAQSEWWLQLLRSRIIEADDLSVLANQLVVARHLSQIGETFRPAVVS